MNNTMISNLISTAKLTGITGTAITLGVVVDGNTHVPIGIAVAVGAAVVGCAWHLSSRLKGIEDRLKNLETRNTRKDS